MSKVVDVHTRTFVGDRDAIGRQLETLAGVNDDFWVTDLVPPMELDRGLALGSSGGHGTVRYRVSRHETGRMVEFQFDPAIGLDGVHRFEIDGDGDLVTVRHTLEAETAGLMRVLWRPMVLPVHSGAVEDVFDHLERTATGKAHRKRPTHRMLRWVLRWVASVEQRRSRQ